MITIEVAEFWEEFLKKNPEYKGRDYDYWHFSNNPEKAEYLAQLVMEGRKTATSAAYIPYKLDDKPLPAQGDISVITDFYGRPLCIIEVSQVELIKFKNISKEQAEKEGEGDLTLDAWRYEHEYFFSRDFKPYDLEFNPDIDLVYREFKRIY